MGMKCKHCKMPVGFFEGEWWHCSVEIKVIQGKKQRIIALFKNIYLSDFGLKDCSNPEPVKAVGK